MILDKAVKEHVSEEPTQGLQPAQGELACVGVWLALGSSSAGLSPPEEAVNTAETWTAWHKLTIQS